MKNVSLIGKVMLVLLVAVMVASGLVVNTTPVVAQDDPCPVDGAVVTWVSPRGTLEVMDDYPLWVAIEMGYFDELGLGVALEPGPLGGANVMSLLPEGQADVGFPSPGVLASSIDAGIPVMIGFGMIAGQTFDFAIPADSDIETVADLEGKTISLGSAAWQPIVDPILAEQGVDITTVNYVELGPQWGQAVDQGLADAALAWAGLHAQWGAVGLDFEYLVGNEFSEHPSNGYAIRSEDLEDPEQVAVLSCFFRGVAMGLEFARVNPTAAAQITWEQFPALQEQMDPATALESMAELQALFNQTHLDGDGYGFSEPAKWESYFAEISALEQTTREIAFDEAVTNQFVEVANAFDFERVAEDAMTFELNESWADLAPDMME